MEETAEEGRVVSASLPRMGAVTRLLLSPTCSREQWPGLAEEGSSRWFFRNPLKAVELTDEGAAILTLSQGEALEDGMMPAAGGRGEGEMCHFPRKVVFYTISKPLRIGNRSLCGRISPVRWFTSTTSFSKL